MAGRVVMLHEGRRLLDEELDTLRERHCVALVPHGPGASREALARLPGCLGVRERPDAFHAVFALAPADAQSALERALGAAGARCQAVGLEEMFIELAGGQS
jgi:ABC-2 type transport system ATP-binding protein